MQAIINSICLGITLALIGSVQQASAQDLDPRAYIWVPVKTTTLIAGFAYSFGDVVTDPTLPLQNVDADVQAASLGIAHSFNFFGLTSQALVAVPYSWAQVSGDVGDENKSITRSGFADMRLRWSVLVLGAPAATVPTIKKTPRKTIIGVSLNAILPTGQFYPDKLINLGTNRYSLRPEIALSQPISKRWLIDVYSGVWFFTDNKSFYPGTSVRTQEPMGSFQAHFSYNIRPLFWIALNATFYTGGQTSIDDVYKDDRQANSRLGITAAMPVGKRNSIKLSVSKGAIVRIGQNFTTVSIGWQTSWIAKSSMQPSTVTD